MYAKTAMAAIALIKALCECANAGEPIYLDALQVSPATIAILKSLGFEESFPVVRMSSSGGFDEKRKEALAQVYALSSHAYAPL